MVNRFAQLESDLTLQRMAAKKRAKKELEPAKAKSLRSRAARRSYGRGLAALNYDVPGLVLPLRQPKSMACWAAVTTMLTSWKEQMSLSIDSVLGSIGQKWLDIYNANTGLFPKDEEDFLAASGLKAKRGFNPSIEGWESLLREYGPLWITTDERPGPAWAIHARIVTGIHGDGTPAGTKLRIIDPGTGTTQDESIEGFYPKFEEEVGRTGRMRYQILHWPTDAAPSAKSTARSISRSFDGGLVPATSGTPWSHYFHFPKGASYVVNGPANYNGRGEVRENTATLLAFTLDMPELTAPKKIRKANVILEIAYSKEGTGNRFKATVNGTVYEDANATITSNVASHRRTIKPSISIPDFDLAWIEFSPDGKDEIDLDVKLDGEEHDFNLERASGPKSLSFGDRYSKAMNPAIAGASLGVSVLRDIANTKTDITWDLKALDGSYHPSHDGWTAAERARYGAGPWKTVTEKVHVAMTTLSSAEISATFNLSFQYNGYYIANVDVEPVGTNDLILWDLHVHGRVVKDANSYEHSTTKAGPFAKLDYTFNFRFSSPVHEDKIFVARYSLFGDGEIGFDRRWTQ